MHFTYLHHSFSKMCTYDTKLNLNCLLSFTVCHLLISVILGWIFHADRMSSNSPSTLMLSGSLISLALFTKNVLKVLHTSSVITIVASAFTYRTKFLLSLPWTDLNRPRSPVFENVWYIIYLMKLRNPIGSFVSCDHPVY